jgi:hypothetical protein
VPHDGGLQFRDEPHDLITQAGVRPAATDLPWIIDLKALGIGPG